MIKYVKWIISLLGVTFLTFYLAFHRSYTDYEKEMRKIASIEIYQLESIDNLGSISLEICDSIYSYQASQIKDTIHENIRINDKRFPCQVNMKYYFHSGEEQVFQVDSFDCAGCSGINYYLLKSDTVQYIYHP